MPGYVLSTARAGHENAGPELLDSNPNVIR